MLYLGIDQHARQLTISLRHESGVLLAGTADVDATGEDLGILGAALPAR